MKVLLLGVGMQGKAALHDLVHGGEVTEIVAAPEGTLTRRTKTIPATIMTSLRNSLLLAILNFPLRNISTVSFSVNTAIGAAEGGKRVQNRGRN